MEIIIGNKSALEYWRVHRSEKIDLSKRKRYKNIPVRNPKISDIQEVLPSELSSPINLLVADPKGRRKSRSIHPHVFKAPIPDWSTIEIEKGVSISSPPFCFFQMANYVHIVKLIELGMEFCGYYCLPVTTGESSPTTRNDNIPISAGDNLSTIDTGDNLSTIDIGRKAMDVGDNAKNNDEMLYDHPQLTNTKELKTFTSRMIGISGYKKVSRAMRYILDGSASPMETMLVMLLTLPYKLGGYGLPAPELNKRISAGTEIKKRWGKAFYVCDLFWQEVNLAVEYDSDLYHTGAKRIASDSKKRLDLAMLGIDVITVTSIQIRNNTSFNSIAKLIAKKLQKQLQYNDAQFIKAQRNLRDLLLNTEK